MLVFYEFNDEPLSFSIEDVEDLRAALLETTRELRARHAELEEDPGLVAAVADRMLNCLSDNSEEIVLGKLP